MKSPLDRSSAGRLAEMFKSLSDPSRLRILSVLADQELSVGAISECIELSESAVSHHLRGLRQMRVVRSRKEGRQVYYCLDDEHIADLFHLGVSHITHW